MRARLKPLAGQVIVVTGAGEGLGLDVARLAAEAGAAVVLAADDEATVRAACQEIAKAGGRVHPVVADAVTASGCDRVARAAAARFERIDSWIEAGGGEGAQAHVVRALARSLGARDEPAALAVFGNRIARSARSELRKTRGQLAATLIKLPKSWGAETPTQAAAKAALHAVARPMGRMAVAATGRRLSVATQAIKHRALLVGAGLLALTGTAIWFGRARIAQAARLARGTRPGGRRLGR